MVLASIVAREAGVLPDRVMLLRHSSSNVQDILARGGSLEEYTFVQPTGSKYDFLHQDKAAIEVVVVIIDDAVHGVFRVLGVKQEGTTYSLVSDTLRQRDRERGHSEAPAKRFEMAPIPSITIGRRVRGWERRTRTPVQRSDGGFFWEIEVNAPVDGISAAELQEDLERAVDQALLSDREVRAARLAVAASMPRRVAVTSLAFIRNPDVIAEVLTRAAGTCERCNAPAPFLRRTDGTPYLEVHHIKLLADGGADTVENAVALCPNCHRRAHYG
jgi:5-methylcytosine-specific restriction endonuclease McrA